MIRGSVVAGWLLTAACAAHAVEYVRIPGSKLVSSDDPGFKVATVSDATRQKVILTHQVSTEEPSPVAVLTSSQAEGGMRVSIQLLESPRIRQRQAHAIELATLEYLYTLTFRMGAEATFCLARPGKPCDPVKDGRSQAEVLADLAAARERAAPKLPWQLVSLTPEMPSQDEGRVGVRIASDNAPVEGATVTFYRAPHFFCATRSDRRGIAACELADSHPEEHAHSESETEPVIATFSGDLSPTRVLPPTTLVIKR